MSECGFLANVGKHLYVPVKQGHWGKIVRHECAECGAVRPERKSGRNA